jgi:Cytochrome P450
MGAGQQRGCRYPIPPTLLLHLESTSTHDNHAFPPRLPPSGPRHHQNALVPRLLSPLHHPPRLQTLCLLITQCPRPLRRKFHPSLETPPSVPRKLPTHKHRPPSEIWYSTPPPPYLFWGINAGPVVRIAPNEVSIDDPEAVKVIYGHATEFIKAPWYYASGGIHPEVHGHDLFTDRDEKRHARNRRKVANAYSMTALVEMEPFVDQCSAIFVKRLEEFADRKENFDLGHWLQCYAVSPGGWG